MEELVKRAKKNDKDAFSELVTFIKKDLYLISKTRLKNEDDIADAIQDTILECYKNIKKLRDNKLFKTWAIKILINKCNKIYRRKQNNDTSIEYNQMEDYLKAEQDEDKISFEFLIRNLNAEEKLILTLYYYSKYTTKEISKILRTKENTIKSKIHRAKIKLKNEYKEVEI